MPPGTIRCRTARTPPGSASGTWGILRNGESAGPYLLAQTNLGERGKSGKLIPPYPLRPSASPAATQAGRLSEVSAAVISFP